MNYEDRHKLLSESLFLTTKTKTLLSCGPQAVTKSDISIELFHLYLNVVRRKGICEKRNDPLFISWKGSKLKVGRYVTRFFKRILGININTTRIRSIYETGSQALADKGMISAVQRKGVLHLNGHSSVTSNKYYEMQSKIRDVKCAAAVHQKLVSNDESSDDIFDDNDMFCLDAESNEDQVNVVDAVSNIGLLHPSIGETAQKIPWTKQEIRTVGMWCKRYQSEHPNSKNCVSKCLQFILNDSDVRQHFHPHHIMDSTRLRWGWERFQCENEV